VPQRIDFGAALRKARISAGLSQTELARHVGKSIWTLNRIEHGVQAFPADLIERLPSEIAQPLVRLRIAQLKDEICRLPQA
jgi:transcriptional regulator with XRE-family HTH domain